MAKIDLESTELSVGGVKLKGIYITVVLAFASTISGGIFAAAKFMHRIDSIEERVGQIKMPDGEPVVKLIETVNYLEAESKAHQTKLQEASDKMAKMELEIKELNTQVVQNDVGKLQGTIATLRTSMEGVSGIAKDTQQTKERLVGIEKDMQVLKKDVDSQWSAIDTLGAGSLKGK